MFTDLIVDVYHGNNIPDLKLASQSGLVGMIHKASEGLFADSAYVARHATARNLGLLWGAYHFGRAGNPVAQAGYFLSITNSDPFTLLCLDLERDLSGTLMPLLDAEIFVQKIKDATGRWPVVYTAKWVMDLINPSNKPTLLSKCPLWVASYTVNPVLPFGWSTWTLWQYTNGTSGPHLPHAISGLGHNDYDVFNGTLEEMKTFWKSDSPPLVGPGEPPVAEDKPMVVNTAKLNVRTQPTTSAPAMFQFSQGQKIVIDDASATPSNGYTWVRVEAWVARELLAEIPPQ